MNQPKDILEKYWGYTSFRPLQEDIIHSVLSKRDTIALLPTGGGKSLCYQIPGILSEGICLVISPLISLMRDQILSLAKKGINAVALKSKLSIEEMIALFDNLKYGQSQFLYLSPERLQTPLIVEKIKELNISCIAVDEAHCISEWGHDFRPAYRQIKNIRAFFPNAPMIALTATATKKVITDIRENLALTNCNLFKKSFFRENLAYQIYSLENKIDRLLRILKKNPFPTIIYVGSRKKTEELANYISTKGFKTVSYHGGMSSEDKQNSFDLWIREERPIIVATNAFGMGIDKPNVRLVIHLDLPYSIENYIQEAGRGGRDGKKAYSVVLQNENDISSFKRNVVEKIPNIKELKEVHKKLYQYFHIAKGEKVSSSFDFSLQEFCERYTFKSLKTSVIIHILKNHGIIDVHHRFDNKSTIQIKTSSTELIRFKSKNQLTMQLIELLLRSHGNIFHQKVKINEFVLAKRLKTTSTKIKKILNTLDNKEIIEYKETSSYYDLLFLMPREDNKTINRHSESIQKYLELQQTKTKQLIRLIKNNEVCRSQQVLSYFGESFKTTCGICDVCIRKKKSEEKLDVSETLISLFLENGQLSKDEILDQVEAAEDTILIHLRNFLKRDIIGIAENSKLYLK